MAESTAPSGQVVAFEGHHEIISTQLRLLPMSPQVLILPTIESYLTADVEKDFNITQYIKSTHDAVKTRNEAARAFLHGASDENKRLVFLNGGTPSAQTLCVRAIMKHETNGDDKRAEEIFNQVAQRGVSALSRPYKAADFVENLDKIDLKDHKPAIEDKSSIIAGDLENKTNGVEGNANDTTQEAGTPKTTERSEPQPTQEEEDPITRAMRAADALDTETADLQPSNELDLTMPSTAPVVPRQRSNSLPLYEYPENAGEVAPFYVFGAQQRDDFETIVEEDEAETETDEKELEDKYVAPPPNFAITHFEETPDQVVYPALSDMFPMPNSPSCLGESYGRMNPEIYTPFSDVFGMKSPGDVVFGEASLLDVRSQPNKPSLTRVRSLDRIYPSSPKYRDLCLTAESSGDGTNSTTTPESARPKSIMVITDDKDPSATRLDYIDGPRTIVVKPKRDMRDMTITVAAVPVSRKRRRATYVDRGTDAGEVVPTMKVPFEPIFPLTEDLIIYFKDESPDTILDRCVVAFKEAKYPIGEPQPKEDEPEKYIKEIVPPTPESQSVQETEIMSKEEEDVKADETNQGEDAEAAASIAEPPVQTEPSSDEYDPFAYVQPVKAPAKTPVKTPVKAIMTKTVVEAPVKIAVQSPKQTSTVRFEQPPTPEKTPTPSVSEKKAETNDKFHDYQMTSSQTAVAVQNGLRSILNVYFSSETAGYHQFQRSFLPELDGLWKPVFREQEPGSPQKKVNRKMDQILAIGSQRGVFKEFSSAIMGQLEKLGTKPSSVSRSGKLDFRYLLANAMQGFTAHSFSFKGPGDPFTNNHLLATLILPHLETYLVLHPDVRYLVLEYPPEHLGTILALQRLIGVDLLKVAQIVDAKSKDLPFSDMRGSSVTKTQTGSLKKGALRGSTEVSVAKANFILTSAATDSEIADFISTVWKILTSVSDFYKPDTPVKRVSEVIVEKVPEKVVEPPPIEKVIEKPIEKPVEKEKKRPPPLTSSFSPFPKITEGPKSPRSPNPGAPPMTLPPQTPTGPPADPPSRPGSIAETTRTFKSFRSKHSRGFSRKKPIGEGKDAMSVYTFNPEEDSDYDDEERRLMPIFLQKRQVRKGNSRKALKFLGLA